MYDGIKLALGVVPPVVVATRLVGVEGRRNGVHLGLPGDIVRGRGRGHLSPTSTISDDDAVGRRRRRSPVNARGSVHVGVEVRRLRIVARRLAVESLRIDHLAPGRIGANLRCRYPMRVVRATGMGVNLRLSTRWRLGP